ncbi:MAG: glycerol-3-phosphate dehydrogenase [Lysobacterales bacterium]|jgi:glycerol-3-phosphate dehydrogenase
MKRNTQKLEGGQYDLVIIGGGINGAAMANLASQQGLNVALVEKGDFASGTSSKSTKLVHGGLRYLEKFQLKLVSEALAERALQLKKAPHLVKSLDFIIPMYKDAKRPVWMVRLGVFIYDVLSGNLSSQRRKFLTKNNVLKSIPSIKQEGLIAGVSYCDAQMDDARLCLENVLQAASQGADVFNYMEVRETIKENGKTVAIKAYDTLKNKYYEIAAKNFICTVGPWANQFAKRELNQPAKKVRLTKGVHIVYRGEFSKEAILIPVERDGRIFFMIPWQGNTLIGTTDTDYDGDLEKVVADEKDIAYLIREVNRYFPDRLFKRENIITTFAGLRPLVHEEGAASKVSREHVIEKSFSGIHYVLGGKYTTYRKIAEECLEKIYGNKVNINKENFTVYGGGNIEISISDVAHRFKVAEDIVENLIATYGVRYLDVLKLIKNNADLKMRLSSHTDIIRAQVVYGSEIEMAQTVDDIFYRRLGLDYVDCDKEGCKKEIKNILLDLTS